ncbi:type II CAAX prenyl endopeptidase Rce1 family protein, partial [Tessaracoccus lubricantis]
GTAALVATLRIEPGDDRFYRAALGLAAIWGLGAVLSGPLRVGFARTRAGGVTTPVVQPLALGVLMVAVFLGGAVAVARFPLLREPVDALLDHARFGSLPVVLAITVLNGVVEELYFRGALFSALPPRYAVGWTTVLYSLTTIGTGVPLLVLAAAALGLVTALYRRVTAGVLAPIVTHITWSTGMLLLLPVVLEAAR